MLYRSQHAPQPQISLPTLSRGMLVALGSLSTLLRVLLELSARCITLLRGLHVKDALSQVRVGGRIGHAKMHELRATVAGLAGPGAAARRLLGQRGSPATVLDLLRLLQASLPPAAGQNLSRRVALGKERP